MNLEQQALLDYMEHQELWEDGELCLVRGTEEEMAKMKALVKGREDGTVSDDELYNNPLPNIEYGFMMKGFGAIVFIGDGEAIKSTRHIKYPNFAAILADNWQLD